MNMYNNNQYEPLTPQTLPFDTYSPQNLSNKNMSMAPSSSVIINTPQSATTYTSSKTNKSPSPSTLVDLLHRKRPVQPPPLVQSVTHQPLKKEKQTKKSSKKTQIEIKQLPTVISNNILQVNLYDLYYFLCKYFLIQHMVNPPQTMLNFPLTHKVKTQRATSRSISEDTLLHIPQQFANPSTNRQRTSTSGDMSFLNIDMVISCI
jgi:hypothetical protein